MSQTAKRTRTVKKRGTTDPYRTEAARRVNLVRLEQRCRATTRKGRRPAVQSLAPIDEFRRPVPEYRDRKNGGQMFLFTLDAAHVPPVRSPVRFAPSAAADCVVPDPGWISHPGAIFCGRFRPQEQQRNRKVHQGRKLYNAASIKTWADPQRSALAPPSAVISRIAFMPVIHLLI